MTNRAYSPHRRRLHLDSGINMTPMLDAIFILVFFFLLATTLRKDEIQTEIRLPSAEMGGVASTLQSVLNIDIEGRIYFEGKPLGEAELEAALTGLVAGGTTSMQIKADTDVNYGRVAEAIDICKRAGLEQVTLLNDRASAI